MRIALLHATRDRLGRVQVRGLDASRSSGSGRRATGATRRPRRSRCPGATSHTATRPKCTSPVRMTMVCAAPVERREQVRVLREVRQAVVAEPALPAGLARRTAAARPRGSPASVSAAAQSLIRLEVVHRHEPPRSGPRRGRSACRRRGSRGRPSSRDVVPGGIGRWNARYSSCAAFHHVVRRASLRLAGTVTDQCGRVVPVVVVVGREQVRAVRQEVVEARGLASRPPGRSRSGAA